METIEPEGHATLGGCIPRAGYARVESDPRVPAQYCLSSMGPFEVVLLTADLGHYDQVSQDVTFATPFRKRSLSEDTGSDRSWKK